MANWGSLLPDDSSLCQANRKLTRTMHCFLGSSVGTRRWKCFFFCHYQTLILYKVRLDVCWPTTVHNPHKIGSISHFKNEHRGWMIPFLEAHTTYILIKMWLRGPKTHAQMIILEKGKVGVKTILFEEYLFHWVVMDVETCICFQAYPGNDTFECPWT